MSADDDKNSEISESDGDNSEDEDFAYFDPSMAPDFLDDDDDDITTHRGYAFELEIERIEILKAFGLSSDAIKALPKAMREHRLFQELKTIHQSGFVNGCTNFFYLDIIDDDITKWKLIITKFPEPCYLNDQLRNHCPRDPQVTIEITFPPKYPIDPPFLRIISPAIKAGHVILGGGLFLDILLPKSCDHLGSSHHYSPTMELLCLFNQLRYSMVDGRAQVDTSPKAVDSYSFERAKFMHDSILGLIQLDFNAIFEDFYYHVVPTSPNNSPRNSSLPRENSFSANC